MELVKDKHRSDNPWESLAERCHGNQLDITRSDPLRCCACSRGRPPWPRRTPRSARCTGRARRSPRGAPTARGSTRGRTPRTTGPSSSADTDTSPLRRPAACLGGNSELQSLLLLRLVCKYIFKSFKFTFYKKR